MISSAPILKHQRFFLRELAYIQIIQPVPDDLSILAHIVSIYQTAYKPIIRYCIPEYGDFSTAEIGSHRLMNIFLIFFFFSAENQ